MAFAIYLVDTKFPEISTNTWCWQHTGTVTNVFFIMMEVSRL